MDKENHHADNTDGILRISMDAKNKVAIGNLSRRGNNWTQLEACDHDFTKEHIVPFGLYLPQYKESFLYFTQTKVTADFIVDMLIDFFETNAERFSHIHTVLLNLDNGPECHSRRTQFIKRICEFSHKYKLKVDLAYYPPYHSKYNPIERVWGGLEQHWNADILDTKETVLKFAQTFVWAGKIATVKLIEKIYETGNKLTKELMALHEKAIDRIDHTIGKWFVSIQPEKIAQILFSG